MIVYVTVFDRSYVVRAIALARSFARHNSGDLLLLACLDFESEELLEGMALAGAQVLGPEAFITGDLKALMAERNTAEFCWTTKPFLLGLALKQYPEADWAVYLDADSLIFGSVSPLLRASNHRACLFTPHNFSGEFAHYEASVGRYNAGFVAFRNSAEGTQALSVWRNLCVESVSATPDGKRYGDQKYLDGLAERWQVDTYAVDKGLNAAPWNVGKYRIADVDGKVMLDGDPLRFFHFQGFLQATRCLVLLYRGSFPLPWAVRKLVYRPYLKELRSARRLVKEHGGKKLLVVPGLARSIRSIWVARKNIALTWFL